MNFDFTGEPVQAAPPSVPTSCCGGVCVHAPYIEIETTPNYGMTPLGGPYGTPGAGWLPGGGYAQHIILDVDFWDAIDMRWRLRVAQRGCAGLLTLYLADAAMVPVDIIDFPIRRERPPYTGPWNVITGTSLSAEGDDYRRIAEAIWTPAEE